MLLRTAAAASSATRTFAFRQASSSSTAPKKAAEQAKAVAGDAAAKAKNVIGEITARSQKIAESSAQRAKSAALFTASKLGAISGKLKPKVKKVKYGAKVGFYLVREVAIREKFGPPRMDQYPAAKAEFLALVRRAEPYVRDPDKVLGLFRAAKSAVMRQCYEPREAFYETVRPAAKVATKESVIAKQAVSENGGDVLLAPFQGRKAVVELVRGSTLNPEIVSFLRSTFVVIEVLSFFAVGEIIGRRSLVGYSGIPDNRPKEHFP